MSNQMPVLPKGKKYQVVFNKLTLPRFHFVNPEGMQAQIDFLNDPERCTKFVLKQIIKAWKKVSLLPHVERDSVVIPSAAVRTAVLVEKLAAGKIIFSSFIKKDFPNAEIQKIIELQSLDVPTKWPELERTVLTAVENEIFTVRER